MTNRSRADLSLLGPLRMMARAYLSGLYVLLRLICAACRGVRQEDGAAGGVRVAGSAEGAETLFERLPFGFLPGAVNETASPSQGIASLACGHDHHAVVRGILEIQEPQQGDRQFSAVRRSLSQDISRAAVTVATMAAPQPGAADGVGGSNASQNGEASRHVEIFIPVTFAYYEFCDVQVCLCRPESGGCVGKPAWHGAGGRRQSGRVGSLRGRGLTGILRRPRWRHG